MTPYFETENGRLYHGDCLEIMPMLHSVDLVLTSPPYNLGKPKKGGMFSLNKGEALEYDVHSDDMQESDYITQQHDFFNNAYKIIKETGAIFYNISPE